VAALDELPVQLRRDAVLLALGEGGEALVQKAGIEGIALEYVKSDRLKRIAYSAADVLVFPTRAENLSLVLLESMACGTPMVSFRVGGVPDLVRPGLTGYLAEPEDVKDLAAGIVKLLEDLPLRTSLGRHCREIAVKEYALDLHVERHIGLYRKVCAGNA
jgi:glycosyltransferase involved in cell wall biosynthesis